MRKSRAWVNENSRLIVADEGNSGEKIHAKAQREPKAAGKRLNFFFAPSVHLAPLREKHFARLKVVT
jgi:hypothetical protein